MKYQLLEGTDNMGSTHLTRSYTVAYDTGGQFQDAKSLRPLWPEPAEE